MLLENRDIANQLTLYGDTALDLAIQHKTSALGLVLSKYKAHFNFNLVLNPLRYNLVQRAVLTNNFESLMLLLDANVCRSSYRSLEGKLASQYAQQTPALAKLLRKAERRDRKSKVEPCSI